jgi:uncharacterized protein YgiB involved in biofilm formation
MKKSQAVPATLVTAVATMLVASGCGCGSGMVQTRRCLDEKGNVIPEMYCERGTRSVYYGSHYVLPRWGYGGTMSGNRVSGFSPTPHPDATVQTPSGRVISRGGFGGSSSSSSSFGG